MKEKSERVEELNKKLTNYDKIIARNLEKKRESASVYYEKANILVELLQFIKDESRLIKEALECYDSAIRLAPKKSIYLADRSKLHVLLGNNELAVKDIRTLKNLPEDNNYVLATYIKNTVEDIAGLDAIQATVTKLLGEGKIDKELAGALNAHADITARLVVQVGTHGDILAHHSNEIKELRSLIDELHESSKDSKREIKKLKQKTANFEIQLQVNTTTIQYHKKILENSDLIDEVQTREDLKKIQHPELQAYCKTFYWSMINLFNTYEMLSTNLIEGNIYKNEPIINKLLKGGTEKALKFGGTVAAHGIPFLGGVVAFTAETTAEIIESIYETVKINEFNNEVNSINLIIQNKFGPLGNMNLKLAQLALSITQIKEEAILHPQKTNPTKLQARLDWFQDKIGSIKNKLLPSTELYSKDNYSVQLALQDVTLLILYLHKNSKTIIQEKDTPLEKQLETIVTQGGLDKLLIDIQENEKFIEIEQRIGQKILDSIHKKAAESNWDGTSSFSLKSIKAKEGIKKYLEENYIKKQFKVESLGDIENIRICIFKHICLGIKQSSKCVIEFSNTYPELIEKIANNYPEFFRNKLIAETCIKNQELCNQVKNIFVDGSNESIGSNEYQDTPQLISQESHELMGDATHIP